MVPELQLKQPEIQIKKPKSKNVLLITMAAFIFLMLTTTTALGYMILQSDKVYKGISVDGIDVSGMSPGELKQAVDKKYQPVTNKLQITLKTEKAEASETYTSLNILYDADAAAEQAFNIGRSGNIFKRFFEIADAGIKGIDIEVPLSVDEKKLESFVDKFYKDTLVTVKEGTMLVTDSNITIRSGSHGENIDREKTLELVKTLVDKQKSGVVEPEVIITQPTKFNADDLYNQISSDAVNAYYTVENSIPVLVPHEPGRKVEKSELDRIAAVLDNTENADRTIPVITTMPEITSEKAQQMLFRDELGKASSVFATGTQNGKNRGYNIELAASKINNLVLAPGQEFSFNQAVGPRDLEHGFKVAHVYSAGKIIDGVGGGICQVSSTMYNAILLADLKVAERRNHSFTVGYVPLGQDATAYYGGVDFRFVNTTGWPVKLIATVKGNRINFSMLGTNVTPDKTVIISSKILKETPYEIKYVNDPALPAGTTKEKQEGYKGYVVETYKTIEIGGKVVSQTKLHTSTYKTYAQVILRGTKPVKSPSTTAGAITTAKPAQKPADGVIVDEAPQDAESPDADVPVEDAPELD